MIEVKYSDRETQNFKITWEDNWIGNVDNLPHGKFVVYDIQDICFYEMATHNEDFELIFLIDAKRKQILRIRSLSPCIYTEEFTEINITDRAMIAAIDKRIQTLYDDMPDHFAKVSKMIKDMQ